ncbi:MAG: hypothetical protein ABJR46_15005 [Tateyamaria sp.]|uniref:hypothetical protein n=1 Tax=Tateyamaria sp. TaxID=1929288 RepID=UPI00329AAD80
MTRSNLRKIMWSVTCLLICGTWVMSLFVGDQVAFFADLLSVKERYAVLAASLTSLVALVVIPALISVLMYFARMGWWLLRNPRKLTKDVDFHNLAIKFVFLFAALVALTLCVFLIGSGNDDHILSLGTLLLFLFICFWGIATLVQFLKVFDNLASEFQFLEDG